MLGGGKLIDQMEEREIEGFLGHSLVWDIRLSCTLVMNVNDIYLVLYYYWVYDTSVFSNERQQIQLATIILVQAYTATRLRILAYKPLCKLSMNDHYYAQKGKAGEKEDAPQDKVREKEYATEWNPEEDDFKTLCYRDIKLFKLKGLSEGRDLPAIELTLQFTKG